MFNRFQLEYVLLSVLVLSLVVGFGFLSCGDTKENECSIEKLCDEGYVCIWSFAEDRAICAPACNEDGSCPDGFVCKECLPPGEDFTSGYCYTACVKE